MEKERGRNREREKKRVRDREERERGEKERDGEIEGYRGRKYIKVITSTSVQNDANDKLSAFQERC